MPLRPYARLLRRNPAFTRLYAAQLISFGGDWFATVALLGLVLQLAGSHALAAVLLVLQVGPFFLASPVAGVLADRLDRRRLMVAADGLRVLIALGFLLARDPGTLWLALLFTALLSTVSAFFEPASSAALPNLVEPEDLAPANVLMSSAWGTMLAVGAGLGGLVASLLGRDAAFVLNAASFLVSGLLIWSIRRPFSQASRSAGAEAVDLPAGFLSAFGETLALARSSRHITALLLSKTTFAVGSGVILFLAVFATDVFHAGELGIGLLFAARGLGALIGPFLARSMTGLDDRGLVRGIGGALLVFLISYLLFPAAPSIWLAALFVFGGHLGGGAQWTLSSYGLQRAAPDRIRGRVFSIDFALVTLTMTVSTLVGGALSTLLGPHGAIYVLLGLAAVAAAGWLLLTRPLRAAPASTADAPYPTAMEEGRQ
ncbi:MAG TPA: MFS transporter [Candidatus Limnocylindrales bacterium]|nr:MFS transporter [Candidatus Limnocylindrales bacterium]